MNDYPLTIDILLAHTALKDVSVVNIADDMSAIHTRNVKCGNGLCRKKIEHLRRHL